MSHIAVKYKGLEITSRRLLELADKRVGLIVPHLSEGLGLQRGHQSGDGQPVGGVDVDGADVGGGHLVAVGVIPAHVSGDALNYCEKGRNNYALNSALKLDNHFPVRISFKE